MADLGSEQAGHLPGLAARDVAWRPLRFSAWGDTVEIRVPALTPPQSTALAAHLRDNAAAYLKTLRTAEIVAILDKTIARLLDRQDPHRIRMERLLPVVTGYDPEMVRLGLTAYLKSFRGAQLQRFLAEDFSNPLCLDGFQPAMKGGFTQAHGPALLLHVWAGNVPGLPLWSLIAGLLVKAGTIGKVPSAEPLMAGWFAQLLAEIDPRLGECLAVVWWKGGDEAAERAWFAEADTVIAYGGNEALGAIRERVPITARFLPHGHKIGFAMISRHALDTRKAGALARLAAYDVTRWEQQGCYSPQMLFVERGGRVSPREFAGLIAQELAGLARKHPRRALTMAETAAIAAWRNAEDMRGFAEGENRLIGDAAEPWSLSFTDRPEPLMPSALNRTLKIVALDSLDAVPALVGPARSFLQTAGIAAPPEELLRLSGLLGRVGVTRIAPLSGMASPEAGWHHDGRFSLLDLVTVTEIERGAEIAAEGFAPYVD